VQQYDSFVCSINPQGTLYRIGVDHRHLHQQLQFISSPAGWSHLLFFSGTELGTHGTVAWQCGLWTTALMRACSVRLYELPVATGRSPPQIMLRVLQMYDILGPFAWYEWDARLQCLYVLAASSGSKSAERGEYVLRCYTEFKEKMKPAFEIAVSAETSLPNLVRAL
jgi:hypothetical protein